MQRIPDDLVPLAVQHGLGEPDGDGWACRTEDLRRLQVIAAPAPTRPRPAAPPSPPPVVTSTRLGRAKRQAEGVQRDDRRAQLARDVKAQRERVAAVLGALADLYDAQGAYLQVLDDQRAPDMQVLDAHRRVLSATDTVRRIQGG